METCASPGWCGLLSWREGPMTAWTTDELESIDGADELELASARRDGTLRRPVTIWVVRRGDDLFVRSVKGRSGPGSAAPRTATKAISGRAASAETSPSSMQTMRSTT